MFPLVWLWVCRQVFVSSERDQTFGPAADLLCHSCADPSGRCQFSGEWKRGQWGETGARRGVFPPLDHPLQTFSMLDAHSPAILMHDAHDQEHKLEYLMAINRHTTVMTSIPLLLKLKF